ncbi:MAG: hypothetical protein CME60_11735 [Halobacteriovoraceae bacterium]|nr:hypothetical protein [Halobacteriovoraceae bacterium]|tara:strand:+ start:735 stop:1262 length:528 start_codon:yes stop_codon:yes gene_type:complete
MEIIEIPNKSAFKLNEVCSITGVKPYVLRFWESEFDEIEPMTSSTGQKLFGPRDIEVIATIKDLLFNQKMSIEEARFSLKSHLEKASSLHESEAETEAELDSADYSKMNKSSEGILLEETAADLPPAFNATPFEKEGASQSPISFQRMSLSDSDLEKLVMAKSLLRGIVDHQIHN